MTKKSLSDETFTDEYFLSAKLSTGEHFLPTKIFGDIIFNEVGSDYFEDFFM